MTQSPYPGGEENKCAAWMTNFHLCRRHPVIAEMSYTKMVRNAYQIVMFLLFYFDNEGEGKDETKDVGRGDECMRSVRRMGMWKNVEDVRM